MSCGVCHVLYIGTAAAVDSLVRAWQRTQLGVGAKMHILQKHLQELMAELKEEEGLGVWSEQAMESSHGALDKTMERYPHLGDEGLKYAVDEYNFLKM